MAGLGADGAILEPGGREAGGRNDRIAAGGGAVFDGELGAAGGRHLEPALQLKSGEAGIAHAPGAEIVEGDGAAVIDEAADAVGGDGLQIARLVGGGMDDGDGARLIGAFSRVRDGRRRRGRGGGSLAGGRRRGRVEAAENLIELVFDAIETLIDRGGRGLRAGGHGKKRDGGEGEKGRADHHGLSSGCLCCCGSLPKASAGAGAIVTPSRERLGAMAGAASGAGCGGPGAAGPVADGELDRGRRRRRNRSGAGPILGGAADEKNKGHERADRRVTEDRIAAQERRREAQGVANKGGDVLSGHDASPGAMPRLGVENVAGVDAEDGAAIGRPAVHGDAHGLGLADALP